VNTEPLPGSLVTVASPPIMRASLRVMARPSPVPPKRCAVVTIGLTELLEELGLLLRGHFSPTYVMSFPRRRILSA
jgi:hypothetical protein